MSEQVRGGASSCLRGCHAEHPLERRIGLQDTSAIVQHQDAFNHGGQHSEQLGAIFRKLVDLGVESLREMVQRGREESHFVFGGRFDWNGLVVGDQLLGCEGDVRERLCDAAGQPNTQQNGD